MVEKAQSGKSHDHAVFVACLNNGIIAHRTAGLSNIGNAAAESTLDIIAEREERIACKCGFAEPAQRGISARNGRFSTEGCERRCQRSALLPARRVQ